MDNQHLTICFPVNVGKLNEFQQNQLPETPELAPFDEEKQWLSFYWNETSA